MRISLIILFLMMFKGVFAQTYTGALQDTLHNPIAFANIIAYLPDKDSTILSFTQSDIQGKFTLSCSDTNAIIQFAFIGYENVHIPVKEYKNGSIITLRPKYFTVQVTEVIAKPPVKEIGDTLVFNADAYKKGNERTVQDLIKKIPGFEVSREGYISFGGKSVREVLVEGDKIGQGDYRNTTQKLSAKVIEDIYVIPDYAENPLLADLNENPNIALNLTLKDAYKNQWLFDTDINGGLPQLYAIKGNITAIRTKTKLIADGKYNNLADYPNTDKFYPNSTELNYLSTKPIVPFQLYTSNYTEIENILYEKTRIQSGHISFIRRFKRGFSLQITTDYYSTQQQYFQQLLQTFFLTAYPVSVQGLQIQDKKEQQFYTGIQITYLPISLRHRVVYQVHFNLPKIRTTNGIIGLQNIAQIEQYNSYYHHHYLEYDYKIKKNHVLLFKSRYSHFDTRSQYHIQPLSFLYVPATDTKTHQLYQNMYLPVQNYSTQIHYVQKKFILIHAYQQEQQQLITNIDTLANTSNGLLNYQNTMKYKWNIAYSELKAKLYQHPKNKTITLQAGTRLMYGYFTWQPDKILLYQNKQQLWTLPSLQYNTKITKKIPVILTYQYQVDIPKITDFQYAYTFTDFRTLHKGMSEWFPRAYHNINANTMYFNLNKIISIFSLIAYSRTKGRFNTFLTVDSLYTFSSVTNQNTISHQVIGYFNLNKSFLPLKHRIGLRTNITSTHMPSDFNEFKRTVVTHTYRQNIGLSSIFRKFFEYELYLDYTLVQTRMQLHNFNAKFIANNHRLQPNAKWILEYKNLLLVYHHFFVQQYIGKKLVRQWHWANVYANYTHKNLPNWRFGLKAYNLFGLKNITETYLDTNAQMIQTLMLQPRIVLGEVSFYFDTRNKKQ